MYAQFQFNPSNRQPPALRLGELAAGLALNWCTPDQVAWSRAGG